VNPPNPGWCSLISTYSTGWQKRNLACSPLLYLLVLAAPLYCGFSTTTAYGADTTPHIVNLAVEDEQNQPISEARIEAQAYGSVAASAVTDVNGRVKLQLPGAGKYVLTISKAGYINTRTEIEITADSRAQDLEVVLPQNGLNQQKVTVLAESPAITEQAGNQVTIAPDQAKETPSRPATLTEALPLIPGVVRRNDGALDIAGYSENHSTLLVNSVDVTDPATGDFGLSVPIDSVETISVSEMPYLAQYGKFIAGVVAAETRRGGDKWSFSLNDPLPEFRIRSWHLVGLKTASPRVNFSGPLISKRLFISEGTEFLLYKAAVRTLPFPFNETKSTAFNSFTQIDDIISPTQMLTATFHFAPHSLDYAGLSFFNPQPVTPDETVHPVTGTVLHRWALGGGVLQSTAAMTRVGSDIQPRGLEDMVLTPGGNLGSYFGQQSRGASRFQWIENWSPRAWHLGGEHRAQIGTVLGYSQDEGQLHARPVLIEDAAHRLRQRIDFTAGNPFDLAQYEPAVYLQDHWVPNSQLGVDFGVRLEAQTITHTVRTAPRSGFVWTPGKNSKTIVRGGLGVFYDSVPLGTYAFRTYPGQIVTSYDVFGREIGSPVPYVNLVVQSGPSKFPFIDRAQTAGNFAPYSLAWNLEAERILNPWVTFRLKYLQSRAEDLITLHPETVADQHALVLGSSGRARTRQFEITAKIGAESRQQFFFSYVRQYAHGDLATANGYIGDFPFPVVRQNLQASLPGEIPNRFLLWGMYALPLKFQLIPQIEYRNGFPYQAVNVYQQYIDPGPGPQPRFPRYFSFDLRASKDLQVSKKYAVRLSLSMLNLTNHSNPLDVFANTGDLRYGTFFGNYPRRFLFDFDVLY
jgi:hypothetical protein